MYKNRLKKHFKANRRYYYINYVEELGYCYNRSIIEGSISHRMKFFRKNKLATTGWDTERHRFFIGSRYKKGKAIRVGWRMQVYYKNKYDKLWNLKRVR